jgi:hypothetical protein
MKIQKTINLGSIHGILIGHIFQFSCGHLTFETIPMIGIQFDLGFKRKSLNDFGLKLGNRNSLRGINTNLNRLFQAVDDIVVLEFAFEDHLFIQQRIQTDIGST